MAFALTPYKGDISASFEDPTLVTIEAELYGWGIPDNS